MRQKKCPYCGGTGAVQSTRTRAPMKPSRLEQERKLLGRAWDFPGPLPRWMMGEMVGVTARTLRRYASGRGTIPPRVEQAVRELTKKRLLKQLPACPPAWAPSTGGRGRRRVAD